MNYVKDLLAISVGIGVVRIFFYIFDKIWSRWTLTSIFVNPKTGISYEIKERKGKFRYYIFGIRVPEKLYDWL